MYLKNKSEPMLFENEEIQTEFDELMEMYQADMREYAKLSEHEVLTEQLFHMKKEHIKLRTRNRMSLLLAKASGDPMYTKYRELILKARPLKAAMLKKYGAKAKLQVK